MERIINRIKKLLSNPANEWPVINVESGNSTHIIKNYLVYLVGVAIAAQFVGGLFLGRNLFASLISSLVIGVLMIVGFYVAAYVINLLSPSFGGIQDDQKAFKLVAYAATASLVAQIVVILPFLGIVALIGSLYSIYLFYVGAPIVLGVPKEKSLLFTLVSILVMVGVSIVISLLTLPLRCS
ncbi:YIP1 family protein [candidate division KSB1 bacterium]|nr:YIP1 family protein [candidate division KSB1 bacterium]